MRTALNVRDRIRRQLVAALCPDEEAVQHGQVLVDGPVREVFAHQSIVEAFDHLRRHLLQAHLVAELLAEDLLHPIDHVLVVDLGRELDLPVSLVVEPVVAGDGEGGPGGPSPAARRAALASVSSSHARAVVFVK